MQKDADISTRTPDDLSGKQKNKWRIMATSNKENRDLCWIFIPHFQGPSSVGPNKCINADKKEIIKSKNRKRIYQIVKRRKKMCAEI